MSEQPTKEVSVSKPDPVTFINYWRQYAQQNKPVGFEGPEKRLEVIIRSKSGDLGKGFRAAPRETWDEVVGSLNAKIVSHVGNDNIDSYVLTESSLFVMANRVVLITCGTTTLLNALHKVMAVVEELNYEVEWASFMRKNFTFPLEQIGPHTNVESEIAEFNKVFAKGQAFIFGPADSDHYFLMVFDDIIRPAVESDCQLSMTMYDMDPEFAKVWYAEEFFPCGPETAKRRTQTNMDILFPEGWTVQDLQFEPCGYSVNSITNDGEYQTMHITPEDFCSFASYETNSQVSNLQERLGKVLSVFRPKRFTVACLLDPNSGIGESWKAGKPIGIEPESFPEYEVKTRMTNEFGHGYALRVFNYVMKNSGNGAAE